jgi:transcriptional regulator with XRE-family HTH domain
MTPGRRQLLAALQVLSETEIALRVGVTQSAVSRWASGETVPSEQVQERLRQHVWTVVGPWKTERRNDVRR